MIVRHASGRLAINSRAGPSLRLEPNCRRSGGKRNSALVLRLLRPKAYRETNRHLAGGEVEPDDAKLLFLLAARFKLHYPMGHYLPRARNRGIVTSKHVLS